MSPKSTLPKLALVLLITLLTMGLAATAGAQAKPWTTVGSAGTVDEADAGLVLLGSPNSAAVTMPAAATGTLNIRYNVVAVDGIFGGDNYILYASFRDNGANARVIVRLKQHGLNTGLTTTLLTLDSNAFAASGAFQVQSVGSACFGASLDFLNNAYFMDVEISKAKPNGTPALAMIKLDLGIC